MNTIFFMHLIDFVHKTTSFARNHIEVKLPPFGRRGELRSWKLGERVQSETVNDEG